MLSVEEALQKILDAVTVLDTESALIMESLGQVMAENVVSDVTVPPLVLIAPCVPAANEPLSTTGLGLNAPELPAGL